MDNYTPKIGDAFYPWGNKLKSTVTIVRFTTTQAVLSNGDKIKLPIKPNSGNTPVGSMPMLYSGGYYLLN